MITFTLSLVVLVLFYLWNDVFKDYAFEDASLFHNKKRTINNRCE